MLRASPLLLLLACTPDPGGPDAAPKDDTASSVALPAPTTRLHDDFGSLVYAAWDQPVEATTWVTYTFDGTTLETPHVLTPVGPTEVLLLGVPYGVDVALHVTTEDTAGPDATITTESLPDGLVVPEEVSGDEALQDPSLRYLYMSMSERPSGANVGLTEDWWVFILDRQGRVVWARKTPPDAASLQPRVSYDGHRLLLDESTFWGDLDHGAASRLLSMTIDGTVEQTWQTPGMHHPYVQIADGSILYGAWDGNNETLEQLSPDGTQRRVWSCADALAERGLSDLLDQSTCASNTLAWRASDDTVLFSMYTLFTVFEIDRATGATLRTYGQLDGSWAMDPPEAGFWWQHGVHWTDEGTLLVSTYETERGVDTIVREYTPDPDTQTLHETWNMGLGSGIWGQYMGEPHRLENGNTLHNTGSEPRLREGTPDGTIVWDVNFRQRSGSRSEAWMGRSTPITDLYDFL